MDINYVHLFLLALLGSILALSGGIVFLYNKALSAVLEKNSVPFAAGVLITVSFFGLIPEAMELLGVSSLWIVMIAFFAIFFFERFFFGLHHHAEHEGHHHKKDFKSSVALVIFGDTIHNFIDGVSIGATYLLDPGLGLITAFSTFLHEVPHEIGDFGILLKSGWRRKNILIVNIISASMAIVGAFSVLLFSENEVLIGGLLSISAGIFLYLGAIDFLPRAGDGFSSKLKALVPLIVGVVVMLITLMVVPHSHENETQEDHLENVEDAEYSNEQ